MRIPFIAVALFLALLSIHSMAKAQEFEEERREIRAELKELDQRREHLQSRLKVFDRLADLQEKLQTAKSRLEQAEEDKGEDEKITRLEKSIAELQMELELSQIEHDQNNLKFDVKELIGALEEFDVPQLIHPLEALIEETDRLGKLRRQAMEYEVADKEPPKGLFEKIEATEERMEQLHRHLELIYELREAYENEDDEHIEGLLEEIEENLEGEFEEEFDGKEERKFGREARRNPIPDIDDSMLPIAITDAALAKVHELDFVNDLVPQLESACLDCHDSSSASGDLDLEALIAERPIVRSREKWINVIEQIRNRAMPPEDGPEVSEQDRTQLAVGLYDKIYNFDYASVRSAGHESVRRLTHEEYDNTIRDLFGVDLRPTKKFPDDFVGTSGFDNSANTLFVQPLLMERYISAADHIVTELLPDQATTSAHRQVRQRILGTNEEGRFDAKTVFDGFLARAFRRPPTVEEVDRAVHQYQKATDAKAGQMEAIRLVVQTALVSPKFLLKAEQKTKAKDAVEKVSDYELANRLSYFLWASMPDDELFRLARKHQLSDNSRLDDQVERMLGDSRSLTLGSVFAAQWLGSINLGKRVRMDPIDNPWCTETLMKAMRDETAMFFHSLVQQDRPLDELIKADYTFLNEELAAHYRMEGIEGDQMRRVSLESTIRGGILAQGSLLAITSFPGRTSPVVRGHWILDTVLGTPPPPPPPNVSELDEKVAENDRLSFREKLEKHREQPNCYACHSQMDPLGLSLEGYDYFGRFKNRRNRIDTRGRMPSGREFEGMDGLRDVIVTEKKDDLARQLSSKMLSYALGRQLEYHDEAELRKIVGQFQSNDYRMKSLVKAIVASYPFNYKQNEKSQ
ncbi:MAG: DUF1592 domain-containing protein [Planctomycetota bacterium]